MEEKKLSTKEIADSLQACGQKISGCQGCALRGWRSVLDCYDTLKCMAAERLREMAEARRG